MIGEYNIYCDESCHLEHDQQKSMVLGAVWCPKDISKEIFQRIREIKEKHNLPRDFEIKWNKVSPGLAEFYLDIVDFFYDDDDLSFRALVIPDKSLLDHTAFDQSHDDFYYKMYFHLLNVIFSPSCSYRIYLDIKDTKSEIKVRKLEEVLRTSKYDFSMRIIKSIQQVRAKEVELIQVADLLTGAISYVHRGLHSSEAKLKIIERIKQRSKYTLMQSTLPREPKTNIFVWRSRLRASDAI